MHGSKKGGVRGVKGANSKLSIDLVRREIEEKTYMQGRNTTGKANTKGGATKEIPNKMTRKRQTGDK